MTGLSLLKTKLHAPVLRPERVLRSRLIDTLNNNLLQDKEFCRSLTLVAAPAGYGKTTLVCQWLETLDIPAAWLSLDPEDNDPVRLLQYVTASIRTVLPDSCSEAFSILSGGQGASSELILTALINEFYSQPEPVVLILDDYHVIRNPAVHSLIAFLLDHHPSNLHLVITTREDPLLPIARLRARSQVLEIRQQGLRFTPEETGNFLQKVMGLDIRPEEIAALEQRTEGWIAGLQLAALSMQSCEDISSFIEALTGSSRFILDFLMEEVFERQTTEVREFLLRTAVLKRLSAPLCDRVAGSRGSEEILQTLDQANLFLVPLDQSHEWFRFHRLFSELLRFRLRGAYPEIEPELHKRAAAWFEEQGLAGEAIHHALASGDWKEAGGFIQKAVTDYLKRGEVHTVIGWFEKLPESYLFADPKLLFDYCWPLLLAGQFQKAEPILGQLEKMAREHPVFLGEIYAAQAYAARGLNDPARMVERSQRAMQLLPENSAHSRGIVALNLGLAYWHQGLMGEAEPLLEEALLSARKTENLYALLTAQIFLGRIYAVRGELDRAAAAFRRALQMGDRIPINALAYMDLAALHYEWNELETSERTLNQAIALSKRGQNDEFLAGCLLLKSRLQIAAGDFTTAEKVLNQAQNLVNKANIEGQMAERVLAARAYLLLTKGDPPDDIQAERFEQTDSHTFYRFIGLTAARCLPEEEKRQVLTRLGRNAEKQGWVYGLISIRIVQAAAADSGEEGLEFLSSALELGRKGRFVRSFAEAGSDVVALLRSAARKGIFTDYTNQILSALDGKRVFKGADLPEPLSERELEVMELICSGMSNREIAEKLVISTGTAKTHVHNICGKLGVRNRTEAAIKAKELELV